MLARMSQPAPKRSRVRDLLTKPIRLPQWFNRRTNPDDPRIFSFNDERDVVVAEVSARAVASCLGDRLELLLNESAHREIARLEKQRDDEAREWLGFWQTVARKLARMSDTERRETLRQVVESMARDIAGNFDPRVYNFSQRVIPGLIAGIMNPKQLAVDAVQAGHVGTERLVTLTGELDLLRSLDKRMRPGKRVRTKARYHDIRERIGRTGPMAIVITETIFQDDDGDLIARARQTAIFR
jgi:glycerol-3-phosphate O-acyltransferase